MENDPVLVQHSNPASLFAQDQPHCRFPSVAIGVPDPKPPPTKTPFDERVDDLRLSGVIPHIPMEGKLQVIKCDEEEQFEYQRRKTNILNGKKRSAPEAAPIQQQEPLPVDQETLDQVKRVKLEEKPLPVFKAPPLVPAVVKPKPEPRPKRQKSEEVEVPQGSLLDKPSSMVFDDNLPEEREKLRREILDGIDNLPMSPPKHEEKDSPKEEEESSSSSDVSGSAVAPDVEEKEPEEQPLDSSSASDVDDDLAYLTSKKKKTPTKSNEPKDVSTSSSSSSSSSSEKFEKQNSSDQSSGEAEAAGADDDDDNSSIGGEASSSSDEDEVPANVRSSRRKREPTDHYDDADFPDEEEKETTGKSTKTAPAKVRVMKSDFATPVNKVLSHPASKLRNKYTEQLPPEVEILSTIEKIKARGKHLTKLYTYWCDMVDEAINTACAMEFKAAGRDISRAPQPRTPLLTPFLSGIFTKHLFEETDMSQFVEGGDDYEILKIQRYFFVYNHCCMTKVERGWSKIELWGPYDWALERDYPPTPTLHVKTEMLDSFCALRIALFPHEYAVYRTRMAITKKVQDKSEKRSLAEFSEAVKETASFKLGLCNDWCVTCQLADLDILGAWKDYELILEHL